MSLTGEFDVTKSKAVTKRVVGHNLGMIAGGSGDSIKDWVYSADVAFPTNIIIIL